MACSERGLALVTVLLLLTLLMVMVMVFSDKVIHATRDAALASGREQALHAAGAGIEWARHRLAATYRATSGWATYLSAVPGVERYPGVPAFSTVIGRVPVDIYLRDNPDGDEDPRRDNDLKLFVLACARPELGPETRIESLCVLDPDGVGYRQAGGNARRSGAAPVDGPAELLSAPLSGFPLRD
jgi:hypothetical protein